jgi:ankyrin repeat protein
LSAVQRLADAGAQLDGKNWNPLHYAAYAGHVEIVRWLIERNAPIDARAPNLQTALMLAAKGGHEAIIRLLIGAGANPDLEDSDSRTAYDLAILANNRAIADYLNEKSSRRQPNRLN